MDNAVGVVDLRAPVVRRAPIVLAVEEHAGERRNPQPLDGLARIQRAVDVHDQRAAGRDLKAQRARDARRIHERVHRQRSGILGRPLEPECGEARELLRARECGVHGQGARRQSVLPRIAAHGAKIAGAEESGHVVLPIRHELHAKTREAHVVAHDLRVDAGLVELEHRRVVDDFARLAVDDLIEPHRLG